MSEHPVVIHVHGRRWYERTNSRTYHSVSVFVDGELVVREPFRYGYGDQYLWTATEELEKQGLMPGREDRHEGLHRYCERLGVKLVVECDDVARKRDL